MSESAPKLPTTARSLPIALIRAREQVMAPIRRMLAAEGITEQQWRVLRVLAERGPQSATEICERACLLPPSLTRIAAGMEEKRLLIRAPSDHDRRSQTFSLAPEGRAIIDRNLDEASRIAAAYRAQLGAERYELLLDILGELSRPNGA